MKYIRTQEGFEITELSKYHKKTILDFLNDYEQSKKNRYLLIQNKQILLNGNPVRDVNEVIHSSDILTLILPEEEIDWVCAEKECIVEYEDAFIYIVFKEPGMIIHSSMDDVHCLNALAATYQKKHDILSPVRPIHRLDKETQGLIIYSKVPFFQPWLDKQLNEKKIHRQYLAVCLGDCEPGKKFTLNQPIGRDRHDAKKYRVSSTGKSAITKVTCLAQKGPYCLMRCELETGRTHQIRVHLSNAGFPIVNDPLYGKPGKAFKQMGLYASSVTFHDPLSGKKHTISSKLIHITDYFRI